MEKWEKNGFGKFKSPDGETYDGNYYEGKMHGKGTKTYSNKDIYEGEWVNGMREGKGKLTLATGDIYDGTFKADQKDSVSHFQKKNKLQKKESDNCQCIAY